MTDEKLGVVVGAPPLCPMSQTQAASPPALHQLESHGYFVLRSCLAPDAIARLRCSAHKLTDQARAGNWPHLRTCPKQFPPWDAMPSDSGIWGVQHLLHPDLVRHGLLSHSEASAFVELYFGDVVVDVVKAIFGLASVEEGGDEVLSEDRLSMELFNMLVTPPQDFALRWHRDDVPFSLSLEDETMALDLDRTPQPELERPHQRPRHSLSRHTHAQYNVPLYPDSSLHIVPGSHRRARTPHEASLLASDPYTDKLPHWIKLDLKPGDIVFYDNNIIHRGVYRAGIERLTLHGSVGDATACGERARNVLQHGVGDWVGRCNFEHALTAHDDEQGSSTRDERLTRRGELMRQNLVRLGAKNAHVGFAHTD